MAQVVAVLAVLWSVFIVVVTLDQPIGVWLRLWAFGLWVLVMGGWALSMTVRIGRRQHAATTEVSVADARRAPMDDAAPERRGQGRNAVLALSDDARRADLRRRLRAAQGVRGPARLARRPVSDHGPEAA